MALWKQPRRRLIDALVVPQLLEEPAREQRVPILSPLALLDADEHLLGVDVRVPQAHDLAHAEAAGVRRHQQDAVLEGHGRSEEHTSELQSHSDLVCRLLLEKKKKTKKKHRKRQTRNGA